MRRFLIKNWKKSIIYVTIVSGLFSLLFIRVYYDQWKFHYPVPPGDDSAYHISRSLEILGTGKVKTDGIYPPGYHALIAGISKVSGIAVLPLTNTTYPLLVVLSGLAVYIFSFKIFGKKPAIYSLALFVTVSGHPYWYLNDGAYPQIIAADVLLIILLMFLVDAYRKKWPSLWILPLMLAIAWTHPVAYIYMAVLTAVFIGVLWFTQYANWKKSLWLTCYSAGSFLVATLFAWGMYVKVAFLPVISEIFLKSSEGKNISSGSGLSAFHGTIELPVSITSLPGYVGSIILWLGVASILFVIYITIQSEKKRKILTIPLYWLALGCILMYPSILSWQNTDPVAYWLIALVLFIAPVWLIEFKSNFAPRLFIISWALIMFLLSRTTVTLWPYRFARDLAFPLIILAGIALDIIIRHLLTNQIRMSIVALALVSILIVYGGRLTNAKYNSAVRVTPADSEIYDWIRINTPTKSHILTSPVTTYMDILSQRSIDTNYKVILNDSRGELLNYLTQHHIAYIFLRDKPAGWITPDFSDWNWSFRFKDYPYLALVQINGVGVNTAALYRVIPQ